MKSGRKLWRFWRIQCSHPKVRIMSLKQTVSHICW